MSEVITTISTKPGPASELPNPESFPAGYQSLERLEIKNQKDGEKIYGIVKIGDTERQVLMPDLAEMWGFDPQDYNSYKANPGQWERDIKLIGLEAKVEELQRNQQELAAKNEELAELNQSLQQQLSDQPSYLVARRRELPITERLRFWQDRPVDYVDPNNIGVVHHTEYESRDLFSPIVSVGAAALAAAALVVALNNRNGDKETSPPRTTVVEVENNRALELRQAEATENLAVETEEANDIARDRLAVERSELTVSRDALRAEQYENRLDEKRNELLLQTSNAQKDHIRLHENGIGGAGSGSFEPAGVSSNIYIEPGHGFTHELKDIFPGYSGAKYYAAHQAAVAKFGPNYLTNVPKYTTASGDIRFSRPGEATLRLTVRAFIENYLKTH